MARTHREQRPLGSRVGVRLLPACLAATLCLSAGAKEDRLPPPPGPDFGFYAARIAPWVEENCASCHRRGGGGFRLRVPAEGMAEAARRREDFDAIVPFVQRNAPQDSRFLRKILDLQDGGDEHVGGSFVGRDEEMHDTLLDFLSGATLTNLPPEVWFEKTEVRAKPGETVVLSGADSYDRDRDDMERLRYWWTLHARPAESRVLVQDRRASRLTVEPDTGGTYVFHLRVGDGKVWSAPRAVTLEVFAHSAVEKQEPGGISGLDKADAVSLRRIRRLYLDVLGRSPTPAEALAEEARGPKVLVRNILLRAESGRAWVEALRVRLGLIGDHRPVGDEAADLALRIPSESLLPHVVEGVLVLDPSFRKRHPAGQALATAIADLLLDRAPTQAELDLAAALAAGETGTHPAYGEIASAEAWLRKVVASEAFERAALRRRLARFLDSGDVAKALGKALLAGRESPAAWRAVLESLLVEPGYLDRKRLRSKDDLTYLRSLYIDLLERVPTDRELTALVRALQTMPGESAARAALARWLIDTGGAPIPLLVEIRDLPRWITDRFLRYLGRRPTAGELAAYGEAAYVEGGGPKLIIQALLTGAEYACR